MSLDSIVEEIEQSTAKGTLLPNRAADLLVFLGVKYARAIDNLMVAKAEYAKAFSIERGNHKSDTSCERYLGYQEVGLTVEHWRAQRDKADKLETTLRGYIYQKGKESQNQQ